MKTCFIWHMHQPFYKDLRSGDYLMPWVRLHGVKDYLDMLTVLDDFPGVKQCFNLVPSLLEQIEDYVNGNAEDRHLYLARKKPSELSREEKLEISEEFFSANYPTMIKPYPRYNQLYRVCREQNHDERLSNLTERDILDLQVWFTATWIDPSFRKDPRIRPIYAKGRGYTLEEKQVLLDFQVELLRRIVPTYRDRREQGKIEISFSPYYHPILPLLVDTDAARIALPQIELPRQRFAHPEDADYQVEAAVELYRNLFADQPRGMWPSEGSVSEAILPIVKKHGIEWIATDQRIYFASIDKQPDLNTTTPNHELAGLYRPYRVGLPKEDVGIIFRDYVLSDKIGFVYSGWDADRAVRDFMADLHARADAAKAAGNPDPVISIILDGENCWEYYRNDGLDFLKELYRAIEQDKDVETVLPHELFAKPEENQRLPKLFAGSWINHNFRVWIGHEEDNRAWDLLKLTRDRFVEFLIHNPDFDVTQRDLAWKEIYIAEGSDWCWWYGDEHQTSHFHLFDRLFRRHLINVWEIIGTQPPVELREPLRKQSKQMDFTEPRDWLTPTIDGRETHFFEWFAAGRLECYKQGGAMHRAERLLHQVYFGYDRSNVYLRIDFEEQINPAQMTHSIRIEIRTGKRYQVVLRAESEGFAGVISDSDQTFEKRIEVAAAKALELAVPQELLEFVHERILFLNVAVCSGEKEVEKWPESGYIGFRLPFPEETLFWEL